MSAGSLGERQQSDSDTLCPFFVDVRKLNQETSTWFMAVASAAAAPG
jgi:hypothetical protein